MVADYEVGLFVERGHLEVAFYKGKGVWGKVPRGVEVVYYGGDFAFGRSDLL